MSDDRRTSKQKEEAGEALPLEKYHEYKPTKGEEKEFLKEHGFSIYDAIWLNQKLVIHKAPKKAKESERSFTNGQELSSTVPRIYKHKPKAFNTFVKLPSIDTEKVCSAGPGIENHTQTTIDPEAEHQDTVMESHDEQGQQGQDVAENL